MTLGASDSESRSTIHWIVEGITTADDGSWQSDLASNRYRTLLPARWLVERGHRIGCVAQHKWLVRQQATPDVAVVGKLRPYGDDPRRRQQIGEHVLEQIGELRHRGTAVIADFCDDHFDHPTLGGYWRRLAATVDLCAAGSQAMADSLARHTESPVQVIGDPVASPFGSPQVYRRTSPVARWVRRMRSLPERDRLELVWYGEASNWPPMRAWADDLVPLARQQPFRLRLVTRVDEALAAHAEAFTQRYGPAAVMEPIAWSEPAQWRVVADADVVLVPVDLSDPAKRVKTSNRLTDALHAGRYVVGSPLPAYLPYRDHVPLVESPLQALRDYLVQPDRALRALQAGQQAAMATNGLDAVGGQWQAAFGLARSQARDRCRRPSRP